MGQNFETSCTVVLLKVLLPTLWLYLCFDPAKAGAAAFCFSAELQTTCLRKIIEYALLSKTYGSTAQTTKLMPTRAEKRKARQAAKSYPENSLRLW